MYPLVLAWCCQHDVTSIAKLRWTVVIMIAINLASSLLLSSNNRVSSFYWTEESKLWFLTSFSYFSGYFLILVFLHSCYLLVSLRLSWLHGNPISCPFFSYLGHSKVVHCTCAPMFLIHIALVSSERDVRGTLVVESVLDFFPISALCQRFLVQTSIGQSRIIPFFLHKSLKLALSCLACASAKSTQFSSGKESSRDFQIMNLDWLLLVLWQLLEDFHSALCTRYCSSRFLALCLIW